MKKLISIGLLSGSLFALSNSFANIQITNTTIMIEAQAKFVVNKPFYVRGGALINQDKNNFSYFGFRTEGQAIGTTLPITFGLFIDGVYTKDNSAIPIGIGFSSYLQQFSVPVFIRADYEFAPEILCFQDAKRFSRVKAEVGVRFIEYGEVFVGYRNISFNKNYNSAGYVGVGVSF